MNEIRAFLGATRSHRRILGDNWKPALNGAFQKVIDDACARFEATEIELRSASRLINIARARTWIVEQAVGARIASVASMARYFNRDTSSIRQALQRRRSRM